MFNLEELKKQYDIVKRTTICYLIKKDDKGNIYDVCLAMKKRGFGEGRWNGSGGKVGDKEEFKDETVEEGAVREVSEELNVVMINPKEVGKILFETEGDNEKCIVSYVFVADKWDGDPSETEEMNPKWFKVDEVPYDEMWADDREWFKELLKGNRFEARYVFSKDDDNHLVEQDIKIVP